MINAISMQIRRLLGDFAPQRENPEIEDPYGLPFEAYATCANAIEACMHALIAHIRRQMAVKAR